MNSIQLKSINYLELEKVLEYFAQNAVSEDGKSFFLTLKPGLSLKEIEQNQQLLWDAKDALELVSFRLSFFPSLRPLLGELQKETFRFSWEELWGLEAFFRVYQQVLVWLEQVNAILGRYGLNGEVRPKRLEQAIFRCVGEDGRLKDTSSPQLLEVREKIRQIHRQCKKKIEQFVEGKKISHYLQDEFLTIYGDRYVVPLKANFKGKLAGIVHDYSNTGETCYLEPYFLVELNNKLQELKLDEKEQELAVLTYLTDLARQERIALVQAYELVVRLDVLLTKVKLAKELDCAPFSMLPEARLSLRQARHPLLVLAGQKVVPVDLELKPGQRGLVITGGNAGGKTVCLKTLGLSVLMALSGLPICCGKNSVLPYWSKVFALLGDDQSLEENLSTFTAQIVYLKQALKDLDQRTLLILDEFGSGTDPSQGAALAQAVLEYVLKKNGFVACATHFPGLKLFALTNEQLRVCSVLFDSKTNRPLYKLIYDQVGASFGLEVAKEVGLPEEIIQRAEQILGGEEIDSQTLLFRLNQLVEEKEKELVRFKGSREKILRKLKEVWPRYRKKLESLEQEVRAAKQTILTQWKEGRLARKKALEELKRLEQRVSPIKDKEKSHKNSFEPEVGKSCLYLPWQKQAVVVGRDEKKNQVKIDLGGISIWCKGEELGPVQRTKSSGQNSSLVKVESNLPLRLDLRGMRVDEALAEVDKYLDLAVLKMRKQVELIHGKGSGTLRKQVQNHLKNHPLVRSFGFAPLELGGDGVTVVELK